MQIIIDGSPVVLKQGTSIEYISENRLFTDADAYTLSITLPLAGCAENLAVFGHINRADVEAEKILLDCEIRDGAFVKAGSVAVTEINDTEVKVQFLEGRSAQNYSDDFSSIYINELELGLEAMGEVADLTPEQAWHNGRALEPVALPWVNSGTVSKDNLVIQNGAEWDEGSKSWRWSGTTKGLSLFHYLIRLVQGVADAVGYEIDLSEWEAREELRYLLVCNTLPWAWGVNEWARALPRWSVEEFFQKLELFLGAQIDVDHRLKSISLSFLKSEQRGVVELQEVVDEFTRTVTLPEDTDETYLGARNIRYKECEHEMWKFYSCDWFIDQYPQIKRYATMEQLLEDTKQFRTWRGMTTRNDKIHSIFYAEDVDTHFLILPVSRRYVMTGTRLPGWQYTCVLRPVNIFGGHIVDPAEDAATDELEFVPAWIDETEEKYGRCLFLTFGGYDESVDSATEDKETEWSRVWGNYSKPAALQTLELGEQEKKAEYYDRIYLGWYDPAQYTVGLLPCPQVEDIEVASDFSGYRRGRFSLRLRGAEGMRAMGLPEIDQSRKSTFSFLADEIPDVRARFLIRGKLYLCAKLTVTFTERGRSRLIKGDFYPVMG